MKKRIIYIIDHWYLFFTILAITNMLGLYDWFSFLILILFCALPIYLKKIKYTLVDSLVFVFIIYNVISCLFSNYPIALYYYGIKTQVISIVFYFLGRSLYFKDHTILDTARPIFLFIFISSILLYFFPPTFYTDYKLHGLSDDISTKNFLDATRMSGFWPSPYFLGATSIISIIYVSHQLFILQDNNIRNWFFLLFALFCLFFSQMRVAIAYFVLFFVALTCITVTHKLKSRKTLIKFIIFLFFIIIVVYEVVVSYMPQEFIDYVVDRSVDQDGGLIKERVLLFNSFFKYISFFGYGLGRFSHTALEYDLPSITDCDYLRLLCELGFCGLIIFFNIIFLVIAKALKNIRRSFCDVFIVGYFLMAMIGAAPLSSINQHSFLFWFCVGHLVLKTENKRYI